MQSSHQRTLMSSYSITLAFIADSATVTTLIIIEFHIELWQISIIYTVARVSSKGIHVQLVLNLWLHTHTDETGHRRLHAHCDVAYSGRLRCSSYFTSTAAMSSQSTMLPL